MKIDQALKQAKKAKSHGNLAKAHDIYKNILAKFPNNATARIGLAEISKSTRPNSIEMQQLIKLFQMGEFKMVVQLAVPLTQRYPDVAAFHNILGATFATLGQQEEAEKAYKRAILIDSKNPEIHTNLARFYQSVNKHTYAIQSFEKAAKFNPQNPLLHYNIGLSYQILGQINEAIKFYKQALELKPEFAEAWNNLGAAQQIEGNWESAEISYIKSLTFKKDYAEAHNNLGTIHNLRNKYEEAQKCFEAAIKHNPNYAPAHTNLCELLEKLNRPIDMLVQVEFAKEHLKSVPADIRYFEALGAYRQKEFEEANSIISAISINKISEQRKSSFLHLSAQIAHQLGYFDKAFNLFDDMNKHLKKSIEYTKHDVEGYFQRIKRDSESIPSSSVLMPNVKNEKPVPVFLIGFPRSGTTLLDTILMGHSHISVVEEQNMVAMMEHEVLGRSNIWDAEILTYDDAERARDAYYKTLSQHEGDAAKTIIDKMPLNITKVPLIHRIFPQARYILAVRHPLDSILSCWMQNFALNSAMGNMLDLKRISQLYDFSMRIFNAAATRYSLNVHIVRYEDLLIDIENNAKAVIDFLNLEWQNEILDYQSTAIGRGRIHTPSYSQVIQPLYTSATDRWRAYEDYLAKEHALVSKWIKTYGYSK